MPMRKLFRDLSGDHLVKAIEEFRKIGRADFLKRYGFSRSSKYYLRHEGQIYDTKSLLAAAYFHAFQRRVTKDKFGGGSQTLNALKRMLNAAKELKGAKLFEDTLGELSYMADEYDRLSEPYASIKQLGFSRWISLDEFSRLKTGFLPGIYIIGHRVNSMGRLDRLDKKIVYVGETVSQNLQKRLHQLNRALKGNSGHSGGTSLRKLKIPASQLYFSIRSFTLSISGDRKKAEAGRSSLIRYLERKLLFEYVRSNGRYPKCNRK